jgi:hypothetical protein
MQTPESHVNTLLEEYDEPEATTETTTEGVENVDKAEKAENVDEAIKAELAKQPEKQDTRPEKPPKGFVPHAALHQERMLRKELDAELKQTRGQMEQLLTLKQELEAMRNGQRQVDEQKLMEEDPVAALRLKAERTEKLATELKTERDRATTQQTAAQRQQNEVMEMMTDVQQMAQEYIEEVPDYPDAFNYLMQARVRELAALSIPQQEISQILDQEAVALAQHAIKNKRNPADIVYNLAKAKGYAFKEPSKDIDKAIEDVDKKIERLEKGGKAAKTLTGGTSKNSSDGLSLSDISSMSDTEFDRAWAEMEKSARKR